MEENSPHATEQFYSPPSSSSSKKGGPKKLIVFVVVLILILGAGTFAGSKFFGSSEEPTPTPSPSQFVAPTDTPTPELETSPTEEVTPTTKATSTPSPRPTSDPIDKSTGLDRSKLSVEVLNGSGTAGVAKKAADLLKSFGYNVTSTGNADNYDYSGAVIEIKSSKSSYLPLLKKDLSGTYTVGNTSTSASGSADARVIIGK